eukprot:TRINITY_DN592_c0_g1_i5.p1 TRINITY_DN592_c0_g1~~TRINITY_DN592_c0_g1_i5.p1  ORF type:complete len:616 (+),score=161.93 TRINITY_DN592_c0_g1_i5:1953-3800(+)
MEDTDDEMPQARSAGGAGVYLSSTAEGRVAAGASTLAGAAPEPPVEQGGAYAAQIFCNRNLNMAKITAVGFDMDYTLSQYHSEVFEMLSFQGALQNLVTRLGYPDALLKKKDSYDHHYFIRGLVVDKARGNIIKMDRHKYVKVALHGFRALSKAEREAVYDPTESAWNSFAEPNYAVLDTIFSIPDAYLFALLIDYKDAHPGEITQSNAQIYTDVRRSVDLCHRDGYIKEQVAADPARFIHVDPNLVPMLERLRRSGRKMFLLTNSLWDYTDVVMSFLYNAAGASHVGRDWKDLFDVIICGSCKPGFLIDKRLSLYRVDAKVKPALQHGGHHLRDTRTVPGGRQGVPRRQLGRDLHQLLNVKTGSQILYVGDHMYSDILRSKRQLGWRTMLVIPELAHEINVLASKTEQLARIDGLRQQQDGLDDAFENLSSELDRRDHLETLSVANGSDGNGSVTANDEVNGGSWKRDKAVAELERLRSQLTSVKAVIAKETEAYHEAFHPVWGSCSRLASKTRPLPSKSSRTPACTPRRQATCRSPTGTGGAGPTPAARLDVWESRDALGDAANPGQVAGRYCPKVSEVRASGRADGDVDGVTAVGPLRWALKWCGTPASPPV